jgi:signal transduction histidine kinase
VLARLRNHRFFSLEELNAALRANASPISTDAAAEERGGHVEAVGGRHVVVTGDRDLLFDALSNLVAIKHGREGGRVTVAVSEDAHGVVAQLEVR